MLWSLGIWYYISSSYGPLRTTIVIYATGYIWQRCCLLVTRDTATISDTNGISYDRIAMAEMIAWSASQPKENQIAKTANTELFLKEASYLIYAAQPQWSIVLNLVSLLKTSH